LAVHISPLPRGWKRGGGIAEHMSRPLGNWQSDHAIDMMDRAGTPVYAFADGVIDPNSGFGFSDNGRTVWGYRFTLKADDGTRCFYTHLGRYAKGIKPGKRVRMGEVVGWLGDPPYFEAHLHLGAEPPANPEQIAARPPRPTTPEERLRLQSGVAAWVSWFLGRGDWKKFGRKNPHVRPEVPAKVPTAWWQRLMLVLHPAPSPAGAPAEPKPRSHLDVPGDPGDSLEPEA
jgi:murein DD-endopeptidase MepM/ murein hydrolase activator NlpD